jgi:hypothetical protein
MIARPIPLTLGLALVSCATGANGPTSETPISESQAVQLAERFVADNGYTVVPVAGAEQRFGTLSARACGVIPRDIRRDRDGWTVTFCYDAWYARQRAWQVDLRDRQRMVVMGPDGGNIAMAHEELPASEPRLKRLPRTEPTPPPGPINRSQALMAATEYVLRNGFVSGYQNDPEREGLAPADASAKVGAVPRLPLSARPCAVIGRDIQRNAAGWSVGFCYDLGALADRKIVLPDAHKRLRFVTMDLHGETIDMADEDSNWDAPGLMRLRDPSAP